MEYRDFKNLSDDELRQRIRTMGWDEKKAFENKMKTDLAKLKKEKSEIAFKNQQVADQLKENDERFWKIIAELDEYTEEELKTVFDENLLEVILNARKKKLSEN